MHLSICGEDFGCGHYNKCNKYFKLLCAEPKVTDTMLVNQSIEELIPLGQDKLISILHKAFEKII